MLIGRVIIIIIIIIYAVNVCVCVCVCLYGASCFLDDGFVLIELFLHHKISIESLLTKC